MTPWTSDELNKIGTAEELQISPLRRDGAVHKPVVIWVVRMENDLYVRSYKGRGSGWFKAMLERHEGRIWAGGVEKAVAFMEVNDPVTNDRVDVAYRAKYGRYPQYVAPMMTPEARATTLKLVVCAVNL